MEIENVKTDPDECKNTDFQTDSSESGKLRIADMIREKWNQIAYKNKYGILAIKAICFLAVLISVTDAVSFGLSEPSSLLNSLIVKLNESFSISNGAVYFIAFLISVLWYCMPSPGTAVIACLFYISYASKAPVILLLCFIFLIFFQLEDKSVLALMIAMTPVSFHTSLFFPLFIQICASVISVRRNNGIVKSLGFVYMALLQVSIGTVGYFAAENGFSVAPADLSGNTVTAWLKNLVKLLDEGCADELLARFVPPLALILLIGLVFSRFLSGGGRMKAKNVDIYDGIAFAVLYAMICAASVILPKVSFFHTEFYSYFLVLLSVILAYICTRPVAGESPLKKIPLLANNKHYIFISYCHADMNLVRPYLKLLRQKGYEFWYDDSIQTGSEWQEVIASNLSNCTCFISFISYASIKSEYCMKEINYATSMKKPSTAVILENAKLPPVYEMHLASMQAVKRSDYSSDSECLDKVLEMEAAEKCRTEQIRN